MYGRKKNKRKNTRSAVWEDITATVHVDDQLSSIKKPKLKVHGRVRDIGAYGMFLVVGERVPVGAKADIMIDFNPRQPGRSTLAAEGKTVRNDPEGIGIRFTRIDLAKLQQCILDRMNTS